MRWCFAPVRLARGEAEARVTVLESRCGAVASFTVLESRCGAAKLPGSAVPGCYAALLHPLTQRAGDGVSGVNRTEGCHGDTRGPS